MKKLYMIRHAKSSWKFDLEDHKRPLKERGLKDAERIGKKLQTIVKSVDKIVSSDAVRAKTTAMIVLQNMGIELSNLQLEPRLYDFNGEQVMKVIKETDNDIDSLMIFGHNHAFTSLVNSLGDKRIDNLPTAGVAVFEFDIEDWQSLGVGKNLLMIFPKSLR